MKILLVQRAGTLSDSLSSSHPTNPTFGLSLFFISFFQVLVQDLKPLVLVPVRASLPCPWPRAHSVAV